MRRHDRLNDRQTEPDASGSPRAGRVAAGEPLEDPPFHLWVEARPLVGDPQQRLFTLEPDLDAHR
jgi:hypothetical protein